MIFKINNDSVNFNIEFQLDPEDYGLYWSNIKVSDQDCIDLYGLIQSHDYNFNLTILNDDNSVAIPSKSLKDLINIYGFCTMDDLPLTQFSKRYTTSIISELMSIFLYDELKFDYYVNRKHIYRIDTGVEIPMYTEGWNDIRDLNDVKFCKTGFIGYTLQYYFQKLGYNFNRGNVDFIYSSNKEIGL